MITFVGIYRRGGQGRDKPDRVSGGFLHRGFLQGTGRGQAIAPTMPPLRHSASSSIVGAMACPVTFWLLYLLLMLTPLFLFAPLTAHADGGAPNLAYVAGTNGISTIDIGEAKVTGTIAVGADLHFIQLSLDGRFLYAAQPSLGRVTMFSARTGQTICTVNIPGQPSLLALDPTPGANTFYAAGNGDSSVRAFDATNCNLKRTFTTSGPVYGLAVANIGSGSIGNQLWVSNTASLTIFDTTGKQLDSVPIAGGPQYISIPPGTMAYVTTRQGSIDALDLAAHHVTHLLTGGTFGPMDYDGITGDIYVPDQRHNQLLVLTPLTSGLSTLPPEPNRRINLDAAPQAVAITSDGQLGFVALSGGNITMLDIPGRQIIQTIPVGGTPHFIITGLYPPLVGTTPQQASTWGTVVNVLAYVFVIALFIVPLLLFRRFSRTAPDNSKQKK